MSDDYNISNDLDRPQNSSSVFRLPHHEISKQDFDQTAKDGPLKINHHRAIISAMLFDILESEGIYALLGFITEFNERYKDITKEYVDLIINFAEPEKLFGNKLNDLVNDIKKYKVEFLDEVFASSALYDLMEQVYGKEPYTMEDMIDVARLSVNLEVFVNEVFPLYLEVTSSERELGVVEINPQPAPYILDVISDNTEANQEIDLPQEFSRISNAYVEIITKSGPLEMALFILEKIKVQNKDYNSLLTRLFSEYINSQIYSNTTDFPNELRVLSSLVDDTVWLKNIPKEQRKNFLAKYYSDLDKLKRYIDTDNNSLSREDLSAAINHLAFIKMFVITKINSKDDFEY